MLLWFDNGNIINWVGLYVTKQLSKRSILKMGMEWFKLVQGAYGFKVQHLNMKR